MLTTNFCFIFVNFELLKKLCKLQTSMGKNKHKRDGQYTVM